MLGKLAPLSPSTNLTAGQQRLLVESQDGIVRALSRSYQEAQQAAAALSLSQHDIGANSSAAAATASPLDPSQPTLSGTVRGAMPRRHAPGSSISPQLDASVEAVLHSAHHHQSASVSSTAPLVGSEAAGARTLVTGSAAQDRFDDIQSDEDDTTPAPVAIVTTNRTPRFATGTKFASPLDLSGHGPHRHATLAADGSAATVGTRDALLVSSFSPGTSFNPALHQPQRGDAGPIGHKDDNAIAKDDTTSLGVGLPTRSSAQPMATRGSRSWEPLPIQATDLEAILAEASAAANGVAVDIPCPAGYTLTVYNGDISQHFNIASETVQITRGSIKYVDHHARYGPQTRFRFQLCHNYLQRKCAKLSECSYIHATVLPKPSEVHLNPFAPRRLAADRHGHGQDVPLSAQDDPSVADAYDTLPSGIIFTVYAPNAGTAGSFDINRAPQSIPSEMIIKTVGAETALAAIQSQKVSGEVRVTTGSRPRHCAHYQFKRLCNLGSQCHFIHSKVPFAEAEAQSAQTTNAALSAAAPPFPSNQQPPQPPSRIPNQQRGPSYGAPVSSGSSYPSSAMSAAPPQQQQQYHVSQGAHAMHPQAQQQQQQQLLNAGISAVALQQYLAAGAAADPNFLAGMQYAAQLLALQQQQPQQFAPPPMPYHQQAASMGGASHHHQHHHHQHPHAQQRYQNAPGNLVFPPAGGQLHPR